MQSFEGIHMALNESRKDVVSLESFPTSSILNIAGSRCDPIQCSSMMYNLLVGIYSSHLLLHSSQLYKGPSNLSIHKRGTDRSEYLWSVAM